MLVREGRRIYSVDNTELYEESALTANLGLGIKDEDLNKMLESLVDDFNKSEISIEKHFSNKKAELSCSPKYSCKLNMKRSSRSIDLREDKEITGQLNYKIKIEVKTSPANDVILTFGDLEMRLHSMFGDIPYEYDNTHKEIIDYSKIIMFPLNDIQDALYNHILYFQKNLKKALPREIDYNPSSFITDSDTRTFIERKLARSFSEVFDNKTYKGSLKASQDNKDDIRKMRKRVHDTWKEIERNPKKLEKMLAKYMGSGTKIDFSDLSDKDKAMLFEPDYDILKKKGKLVYSFKTDSDLSSVVTNILEDLGYEHVSGSVWKKEED